MKAQKSTFFLPLLLLAAQWSYAQTPLPGTGLPALDPITGGSIVVPNPGTPGTPGIPGTTPGIPPYYPPYTPPNMTCDTYVQGAKILSSVDDPNIVATRLDEILGRGIVSRAIAEEITHEIKEGDHLFAKLVVFRQDGQPNLNTLSNRLKSFLENFQGLDPRIELVKAGEAIEREFILSMELPEGAPPVIDRFSTQQLETLKKLAIKHIRDNTALQSSFRSLLESRMLLRTDREAMGMNPDTVKKLHALKVSGKPVTLKELVDAKLSPWGRMWFKIQLRKDWLNSTKLPAALIRSMISRKALSHEEFFRLMGYNNLVGASNRNGELYTKIKTLLKEEQLSVINDLFASQEVRFQLKKFYEQQIDITQLITSLETLAQGSGPLIPVTPKGPSVFQTLTELFGKKPPEVKLPDTPGTPPGTDLPAPSNPVGTTDPVTTDPQRFYSPYSEVGKYNYYGSPSNYGYNYGYTVAGAFPANKVVFEVTQQIAVDLFLLRDLAGVRVGIPGRFQTARDRLDLFKKEYIVLEDALIQAKMTHDKAEVRRLRFELDRQKTLLMNQARETQEYATQVVTSYMNWSLHANLDKGLLGNEVVTPIALPEPLRMSDKDLAAQWSTVYDEAFEIAVNPLYRREMRPAAIDALKKVKDFFTRQNDSMKKYWDTDFFDTPLGKVAKEKSRKRFTETSKNLFSVLMFPGRAVSNDPLTQKLVTFSAWTAGSTFIGMNSGTFWDWMQIIIKEATKLAP